MPNNPFTHFVLVDFENRPGIDLALLAAHPVKVTLFLGQTSKLKPALVDQITTLPFEVRLVKVGMTRKNALDFVLAYHLGEMLARYPRGHYYIISEDKKDFDPLVTYLLANHVHVSRHIDVSELPFLAPPKRRTAAPFPPPAKEIAPGRSKAPFKLTTTKSSSASEATPTKTTSATKAATASKKAKAEEKFLKLIPHLQLNHPKTRETLMRSVAAYYGDKLSSAEVGNVVAALKNRNVLSIDGDEKVSYRSG